MSRRTFHIIIYVIGSVFFLLIPIVTSPDFYRASELINIPPFQRDFFSYILLLCFFYLTYFFLIPKFYFQKKTFLFFVIVFICYLILAFLPWMLIPENQNFHQHTGMPAGFERFPIPPHNNFLNLRITGHLAQFFMVLVLALMIRINIRFKKSEREKLGAELSYLKAQINPHFLFNTLNSIYSLALEKSDETAKAVFKLSSMMRFVTTEAYRDFVSLEEEIAYISS